MIVGFQPSLELIKKRFGERDKRLRAQLELVIDVVEDTLRIPVEVVGCRGHR